MASIPSVFSVFVFDTLHPKFLFHISMELNFTPLFSVFSQIKITNHALEDDAPIGIYTTDSKKKRETTIGLCSKILATLLKQNITDRILPEHTH